MSVSVMRRDERETGVLALDDDKGEEDANLFRTDRWCLAWLWLLLLGVLGKLLLIELVLLLLLPGVRGDGTTLRLLFLLEVGVRGLSFVWVLPPLLALLVLVLVLVVPPLLVVLKVAPDDWVVGFVLDPHDCFRRLFLLLLLLCWSEDKDLTDRDRASGRRMTFLGSPKPCRSCSSSFVVVGSRGWPAAVGACDCGA